MHSKLPLKSLSEMSNIRRMVLHPNIMRPLGQSFTLFEHKAFEKNAVLRDYILKSKGPNVTGTILNCYFMLKDQSTHTYNSHRYTLGNPKEMNNANDGLIPIPHKRLLITPHPCEWKLKSQSFSEKKSGFVSFSLFFCILVTPLGHREGGCCVILLRLASVPLPSCHGCGNFDRKTSAASFCT